jgi:hypothetical protein
VIQNFSNGRNDNWTKSEENIHKDTDSSHSQLTVYDLGYLKQNENKANPSVLAKH